ncbi:Prion-like-(Q/N-rich)-domain-bearing protein [Caenorhabditis elegans]|uniref:Prion-like-(Q/N-rich)-domain-bearing protein n=1 Tax=Caenorhabditis elegans TaxID=6239 RepID=Q95YE5_CAEEL|nr:Prion-like-(Q/N-rich)-domain-bearing protein [Caenorhabditis elegans]CCD63911.2 Prion-like-(Q/N-rich)-domain-bearing protein [Caenorhabditis elegans]
MGMMSSNFIILIPILLSLIGNVITQFIGYPYDYSSMYSGYSGYNPMMSMSNTMGSMGSMGSLGTLGSMGSMGMNTMGMNTGFGTFGTGMESLYGGATQQAFGAYNPYGNGLFNFGSNGMFGQNAFGTGFNNNLFGASTNGLLGGQQQQQLTTNAFQNSQPMSLNNGNTMKAYGRRTQNFNNNNNNMNNNQNHNYAPTRAGQNGGCNGFGGDCQQGWNKKTKKV